jgi:hypothetical protein
VESALQENLKEKELHINICQEKKLAMIRIG